MFEKFKFSSPTEVEKSVLAEQKDNTQHKNSTGFTWKKGLFYFSAIGLISICLTVVLLALYIFFLSTTLPNLVTANAYKPRLVSEVFDVSGEKIGEFFREKRKLIAIKDIPEKLMQAFIAAEDASFYEHQGINYLAILRAFMVNLREGRKVQGGSTITQQVARSLLLTREKTYTRKLKEVLLAYRMEAHLTKEEILYLYLNQIYLGYGVYGVVVAAEVYFRKDIKDLTLEEVAILAGLPQAPSRYSPIINPRAAKNRQKYVLKRMEDQRFISKEEKEEALQKDVKIYFRKNYEQAAPYYVETIRQQLVKELGEDTVLDQGVKVYTNMDIKKQIIAQESLKAGLRQIDKRQGYRGAKNHLESPEQINQFLSEEQRSLMDDKNPSHIINSLGEATKESQLPLPSPLAQQKDTNIPNYIEKGEIIEGIVTQVDDRWGLVTVRFPESKGLIDIESMKWATSPDPNVHWKFRNISRPSQALKTGDVIEIKVVDDLFRSTRLTRLKARSKKLLTQKYNFKEFALLELEQEPLVQGALVSFDLKTENLVAMVGGRDFRQSKFNRAIQALRQSGSSFKPIIYLGALDKGFKPNSVIADSPIVYKEEASDKRDEAFTWRPGNYSARFGGDTLLRNALKQSKNIPTVKILEQIGVDWVAEYAKRLGIFHPLNMDLSLGLGSSSVTLYEMTKVFAHFARLGRKISPLIIDKVENMRGETILGQMSMDQRFKGQLAEMDNQFALKRIEFLNPLYTDDDDLADQQQEQEMENTGEMAKASESDLNDQATQPLIFFEDSKQLIVPQTAYLITSLLRAVVEEQGGTGARARSLGRTSAGKTGTTNGYFDAWYVGYTPQFVTGVWVGFDDERTLGRGETGSSAALPIWLEYMKQIHEGLQKEEFTVPDQIVFANIDNETGYLASASSKNVVMQAFLEGTQPTLNTEDSLQSQERHTADFYKEDLSE